MWAGLGLGLSSVGPHLLLSAGLDHLASMASMAGKVTPSPRPSITRTWAGRGKVDRASSLTAVYRVEEVDAATVGGQGGDESEHGRDQHSCTGTGHNHQNPDIPR